MKNDELVVTMNEYMAEQYSEIKDWVECNEAWRKKAPQVFRDIPENQPILQFEEWQEMGALSVTGR